MMGTLSLSLTGFSSILPGVYQEVRFAQGQVNGNASVKKVLFIGVKTSAGSATVGTQVYEIGSENEAITLFGTGSFLHRAMRRFFQKCKSARVFGICAAESAGSQATDSVTFTGVAGSSGVASYTCVGETITIPIPNGQAAADSATALISAINLQTHWPITAGSGGAGVVTVTARIKGTSGNWIRHRASTTTTTQTLATTLGALATGATDELYTTVLSTILASDFDYIVPCINPTGVANTAIGALKAQVINQALPSTGIRQMVICAGAQSAANQVSFVAEATNGPGNQPQFSFIGQVNSEWEPMEIAAYVAAIRYNAEAGVASAWANYDGYGITPNTSCEIPRPYSQADYPSASTQGTLIAGGVTPIAVDAMGRTYITQMVTCSTDVRVRDVAKVAVAYKWCDDLAVRYTSRWATAGVQDDPVNDNDQPAPSIVTPKRIKSLTIAPLYIQYCKSDPQMLDSAATLNAGTGDIFACATGIDPVVNTRINARTPLHVMPLCHQFAALVTENSSG